MNNRLISVLRFDQTLLSMFGKEGTKRKSCLKLQHWGIKLYCQPVSISVTSLWDMTGFSITNVIHKTSMLVFQVYGMKADRLLCLHCFQIKGMDGVSFPNTLLVNYCRFLHTFLIEDEQCKCRLYFVH